MNPASHQRVRIACTAEREGEGSRIVLSSFFPLFPLLKPSLWRAKLRDPFFDFSGAKRVPNFLQTSSKCLIFLVAEDD